MEERKRINEKKKKRQKRKREIDCQKYGKKSPIIPSHSDSSQRDVQMVDRVYGHGLVRDARRLFG